MAQATLSCPFGAIHLEMRWGPIPVSAFAERALTVILPPDPRLRETPSRKIYVHSRRAKTRLLVLLAPGTQAPSSSQSPLYSGRPNMGIRHVAPLLLLSPPNPLRWALAGTPIKCPRCTDTACSGKTVAAGPPDHRRTKQVGRHQAVCVRVAMPSNFDGNRPQWAENRRGHGQSLGRRKIPKIQRDTSP